MGVLCAWLEVHSVWCLCASVCCVSVYNSLQVWVCGRWCGAFMKMWCCCWEGGGGCMVWYVYVIFMCDMHAMT